jgi:hypothetical protein
MAKKPHSSAQVNSLAGMSLTLADTYGLGLIAFGYRGVNQEEIVEHLSARAKKIAARVGTDQGTKKKSASKRRVSVKR